MSYSLNVNADSKTAAILAAEAKFKEMLASQPIHAKDEAAAFANLREHMALVKEPSADEEISVGMHGSIWVENDQVKSCGSGCSISVMTRSLVRKA